ncbi:MAG TPA: rhombosortase [Woeseiaceae bacterium]|nr:rhombosortase [Woeseiaceae bacterium]
MGLHQASEVRNGSILRRSTAWVVPLLMTAISLLVSFAGTEGQSRLRYERQDIAEGELWRLVTGHFAHLGLSHMLLNIAGLALVWLLVGGAWMLWQWAFITFISLAFIDLGFWFLDPGLNWYVGLSGLLHSMLVAGIVGRIRDAPGESLALGAIVLAKIAWEQLAGPLPGSESSAGGAVVVNAHLYGAMAGIIAAGALRLRPAPRAPI